MTHGGVYIGDCCWQGYRLLWVCSLSTGFGRLSAFTALCGSCYSSVCALALLFLQGAVWVAHGLCCFADWDCCTELQSCLLQVRGLHRTKHVTDMSRCKDATSCDAHSLLLLVQTAVACTVSLLCFVQSIAQCWIAGAIQQFLLGTVHASVC